MKKPVQRVAAIHDLSGFGRVSLAVVIPILSTMGIQVCPLPTAVLSTHTGSFKNYKFIDLTTHMTEYIAHWKEINIDFDCIYSGFLGSPQQIDIISHFIDDFAREDTLVVVDPVMGDGGKLYSSMNQNMVREMRKYIQKADLITPNYTEVLFLLGEKETKTINDDQIKDYLRRLVDMGPRIVIITSVPTRNNTSVTNVIAYNKDDKRFWKVKCNYIPVYYPGTGDVFTSVVVGSLLQGDSLPIAMDRAVQFITAAIRASYGHNYPQRNGIMLERVLGNLTLPVIISSYELL
ncbi:MAG: pyridoxamine kinase [Atribacterota bacterium]|nr:pyridoxamine kinase [Atribacterota bacterium]